MKLESTLLACVIAASLCGSAESLRAQQPQGRGFFEASLNGSYSAREAGDGSVAAGLGVIEYDGAGQASRKITVNAPDGEGGRRLLVFESEGTYTVNPDGTGTAVFTNTSPNPGAVDTFDFVITGVAPLWTPGRGRTRIATELVRGAKGGGRDRFPRHQRSEAHRRRPRIAARSAAMVARRW